MQEIYTTLSNYRENSLRKFNSERRGISIVSLVKNDLKYVLTEKNNIQVVNNNGLHGIPGLITNPTSHKITSKIGLIQLLNEYGLNKYLPGSFIVKFDNGNIEDNILSSIQENFQTGEKVVIKHPHLDGNGNGVHVFINNGNRLRAKKNISIAFDKFANYLGSKDDVIKSDYLLQKFINNTIGEGSITFSIQNYGIDNRGMMNNHVENGEYFASTNHFSFLNTHQLSGLEERVENDFKPLMDNLRDQGIRGNIGFDIVYRLNNKDFHEIEIFILESNGLYRTTGSTLPNSFRYNSINEKCIGIPLVQDKLQLKFSSFDTESQISLAEQLKSYGTTKGMEQIMNLKCEGFERGYPAVWISVAGRTYNDLKEIFLGSNILNEKGSLYVKKIFNYFE